MATGMEHLFAELFEAAGAGRRLGEAIAARAGQTQARWQTLWTLGTAPLTVPQVARRLGVSRQHILRLTNELTTEGLIEPRPNPDHKTSPLLRLTPAGESTLATINEAALRSNDAILAELTPERVTELRDLLRRFTELVKEADA
ncbi:MarR family winged helix-turn-helix transcriptional regulator [Promicromonospora sukumoe]|uniref:MarR family winged helix-turn-helix transcriptional regulator n=1 Tax=Promicromonospora sukumoe TaxID=88382 RepID=UPI000399C51D|nr:MarR family transcriptional regulator [Promicromonospora sukumoe]